MEAAVQKEMKCDMYTMCLIVDGDRVLLINRPDSRGFPGFIGPGGRIEMPESPAQGAIREVWEETGLRVKDLTFKGIDEYVNQDRNYRYIVFNYIAASFEGELLNDPPEGELHWVPIREAEALPMQPWFRRRFPLFFEEGTFEIHEEWEEESKTARSVSVRKL
ncbi:8-oxo-dGTP diphosphatase [Paenibacillus humicola]|uniref:8-oxo-dGTP diphosphatase n=1 Tax=Paenibacillus humicola TaxID=3110540 RepID=UPI00237B75A7|nr:8-oxo-dGTP diphosphatase [Paenibacillus humicola]